ncbi:hypothetical protein MHBO_001775 [Bonamia ostreae]|uniref:Uncharacterized protein n=1 Tax=Bonamia ostreae TaxID=126728 RepID=A0ABV2AKR2_9EUKA
MIDEMPKILNIFEKQSDILIILQTINSHSSKDINAFDKTFYNRLKCVNKEMLHLFLPQLIGYLYEFENEQMAEILLFRCKNDLRILVKTIYYLNCVIKENSQSQKSKFANSYLDKLNFCKFGNSNFDSVELFFNCLQNVSEKL